jgi:hypothetical protein
LFALTAFTGCGDGDGGGNTPPPSPSSPAIGTVALTLAAPTAAAPRIGLAWSASGAGTGAIAEFRVLLGPSDAAGYAQVAGGIAATANSHLLAVPSPTALIWPQAKVKVQACDAAGTCIDSNEQPLTAALLALVGYFKASNTGAGDQFGASVALSADGNTMAVGAYGEDSSAVGINGNQTDNSAVDSGAVYVFVRDAGTWRQQAYLKGPSVSAGAAFGFSVALSTNGDTLAVGAYLEDNPALGVLGNRNGAVHVFVRNAAGTWTQQAQLRALSPGIDDFFGAAVALSANGDLLAVGAYREDSNAVGIDGSQASNATADSGAVYLFTRIVDVWSQTTYIKASNTGASDGFGVSVALAADGNTLAVGALFERSPTTGVDGNQLDDSAAAAGAVYTFARSGAGVWSQEAYLKASNTGIGDIFGTKVVLSADGNTLAVGALSEDSGATGVDGNHADDTAANSGAVYVFVRTGTVWRQQAYLKASNTGADDRFGVAVALSADGNTLLVGATGEDGNAIGIGGDAADNSANNSGAAYLFVRAGTGWVQRAYVKAPNTDAGDVFGLSAAVSADGSSFAVAALFEASAATGIGGDRADDSAAIAGAVFLF